MLIVLYLCWCTGPHVCCRIGGRPVNATWAEPKKNEDTSQVTIEFGGTGSHHCCSARSVIWLYSLIASVDSYDCECEVSHVLVTGSS